MKILIIVVSKQWVFSVSDDGIIDESFPQTAAQHSKSHLLDVAVQQLLGRINTNLWSEHAVSQRKGKPGGV